jgi:hypothetical protein
MRRSIQVVLIWMGTGITLMVLLAGCASSAGVCDVHPYADLSGVAEFIEDDGVPFRFPLAETNSAATSSYTLFCSGSSGPPSKRKYHAAEDYFQPAGTPVYAMADGVVSFSGLMGGYGWLIIIDHPQANLYSLYGHLSPSRWRMDLGDVQKGALIAYLGDEDENGGSSENPLEPHLHLGVRAGQRVGYPSQSAWRWQAGWIKPCPVDLGWLQPSVIITQQEIPIGGFPKPAAGLFTLWWIEILFGSLYLIAGVGTYIYATQRNKSVLLIVSGSVFLTAGYFFYADGWKMSMILFPMGVGLLGFGLRNFYRSARGLKIEQSK